MGASLSAVGRRKLTAVAVISAALGLALAVKLLRASSTRHIRALLVGRMTPASSAAGPVARGRLDLELAPLPMSAVKKRALAAGVGAAALELAYDEENPRQALISILVEAQTAAAASLFRQPAGQSRAELAGMKLSVLKKRAAAAGVELDAIDDALDLDDPKEAIIAILLEVERAPESEAGSAALAAQLEARRAELTPLRLSALRKRAADAGVSEEQLDEADDDDNPKQVIISILLETESTGTAEVEESVAAAEVLRAELTPLKLSALRKRAAAAGVSEAQLDEADDSDNVKAAVVELVVVHETTQVAAESAAGRPHFGRALERARETEAEPSVEVLNLQAAGPHAMLSYQWGERMHRAHRACLPQPFAYAVYCCECRLPEASGEGA